MSIHDVAIVGVYATTQAKRQQRTALSLCLEAALGAVEDAGLSMADVDGIAGRWPGPGGTLMHPGSMDWATLLGREVTWVQDTYPQGVPALLDAASAIANSQCNTVLVVGGQAGIHDDKDSVAAYTRPENEFVAPWGAFTAVHFALVAQRYLDSYPNSRTAAARVAAYIRNQGSKNPHAVMYGRGPYEVEDILAAPPIATPFTLLDLCLATEGAAAMVISRKEIARNTRSPVWLLGGACEWYRQQYVNPARYEEVWTVGRSAAERAFRQAGCSRQDVDVAQLYDINSFEVLRQLETIGFCEPGEAADFIDDNLDGEKLSLPINTDGGLMSYSHIGWGGPTLKIVESVHQLRNEAAERQVPGAAVALATGAGSGAQYHNIALLGREAA